MAAIAFNTAQTEQAQEQIKTVFTAFRELLDASVSNCLKQAAAEARHPHPRQFADTQNAIEKRPMTTMQLTIPFLSSRKLTHVGIPPTDKPDTPAQPFGSLDPNVVSDAIPAFFIGRDRDGFWVAREAKGRIGGLFLFKSSAVAFARAEGGAAGCATIFPAESFELDLANQGNPIAEQLAPLVRRARSLSGRIGQLFATLTRRSTDFHAS